MAAGAAISEAIRNAKSRGRPAVVAYVTAGFPRRETFLEQLAAVAEAADVVEIGVPFTDPMADGTTIQRSSRAALAQGVSLNWILAELSGPRPKLRTPLLLMSYLNPLLAYGLERLPEDAARAGVAGFIVPDLPFEECEDLRAALAAHDVALVQFVTPVTPTERIKMLCAASSGFIYAVTMTGTTGKNVAVPEEVLDYFARVKKISHAAGLRGLRHPQSRTGRAAGAARRWRHRRFGARGSAGARRRSRAVFAEPRDLLKLLTPVRAIVHCRAAGTMSSLPLLCRYALHGYGDSDGHEMVAGPTAWFEEAAARQAASYGIQVPRGLDNSRRQRLRCRLSLHAPAISVCTRAAPAAADMRRTALHVPLQAPQRPPCRPATSQRGWHDGRAVRRLGAPPLARPPRRR